MKVSFDDIKHLRLPGETWRSCVERIAKEKNLQKQCLVEFDEDAKWEPDNEEELENVAYDVLYDYGLLDASFYEHPPEEVI